jgi:hypothetical protein
VRHALRGLEVYGEECSYWIEWVERCLTDASVDAPGPDTRLLVAARSVRLADRVSRLLRGHLPSSLRKALIEASILHQCWEAQAERGRRASQTATSVEDRLDAVSVIRKHSTGVYAIECSDGHTYSVKLPCHGEDTALATEFICLQIARQFGLPVRPARLVLLSRSLGAQLGVQANYAPPALHGQQQHICCLGIRELGELTLALPANASTFRYSLGRMVFDIFALGTIAETAAPIDRNGRMQPTFGDFSHCMLDSDWPKFLSAGIHERCHHQPMAHRVRSYLQLDVWIRRAEKIDMQQIAERAFKLPPYWYGNKPLLLAGVLEKLVLRTTELRGIVYHLAKAGQFPELTNSPSTFPKKTDAAKEVRQVLRKCL